MYYHLLLWRPNGTNFLCTYALWTQRMNTKKAIWFAERRQNLNLHFLCSTSSLPLLLIILQHNTDVTITANTVCRARYQKLQYTFLSKYRQTNRYEYGSCPYQVYTSDRLRTWTLSEQTLCNTNRSNFYTSVTSTYFIYITHSLESSFQKNTRFICTKHTNQITLCPGTGLQKNVHHTVV